MVYYKGSDVKVYITTETDEAHVKIDGTPPTCKVDGGLDATTHFAHKLTPVSLTTTANKVSDLTGVDIGISAQDEDISYVGNMGVLKTEIKKETTVSLTLKKSSSEWDVVFGGPTFSTHEYDDGIQDLGARWGVAYRASGGGAPTANLISNGLIAPSESKQSDATICFGYRVHVQLKSGGQWLSIPGCQITGHTVSINGDGTSEETLEFSTNVDLKVGETAGVTLPDVLVAADM